jgi:predicted alpha/beta superfamily hydrolase
MQDLSLLDVAVVLTTIMLDYLYSVPTPPLVGTGMEITSIFIPAYGRSDFTPLLPNCQLGVGNSAQQIHYNSS